MRLSYICDAQHLYWLPDFSAVDAPGIVWSARSASRRGLSKIISHYREAHLHQAPTLRPGLHPMDMRHDVSHLYGFLPLTSLLDEDPVPMTQFAWLQSQHTLRSAA